MSVKLPTLHLQPNTTIMANVTFSIKKSETGKLSTIYVRYYRGKDNDQNVSTGLSIDPEFWDKDKVVILTKYPKKFTAKDAAALTADLDSLRAFIVAESNSIPGQSLPVKWLKKAVQKHNDSQIPAAPTETFNQYLARFLKEAKAGKALCHHDKVVRAFPKSSLRGWVGFEQVMTKYQDERKRTIDFADIDREFFDDFIAWLYDRNLTSNYTGALIKKLKNILGRAEDDGLYNGIEIKKKYFKSMSEDTDAVFLTHEDIEAINKVDLSQWDELREVRDVFLVGCYCGQRFSDYSRISADNVRVIGGKKYLVIVQQKTGVKAMIPFNQELDKILSRYDYRLPRVTEAQMNDGIKSIGQQAKLFDVYETKRTEGGHEITRKRKKYKMLSSHSARRTACTLWYLDGVDTVDIMMMSGHKSHKQLLDYIKVTPEDTARRLSTHQAFTQLRVAR